MYKILTLNKISEIGINKFGDRYVCGENIESPDCILVRSASMHDMSFDKKLLAIARAGAGVNNIPTEKCSEAGIAVFNTPGANANAVKELVISGLLLSSRKIVDGIIWAKSLKGKGSSVSEIIEKGKGNFSGPEIKDKKIGIIGLGAIGIKVANTCEALMMDVIGYDPFLSISAALELSRNTQYATSLDTLLSECDYISIHIPLNDKTKYIINAETISKMKDGVRILNFSRDALVNTADLIPALKSGKVSCYVTDFVTDDLLDIENVIAIPHLGASTPESEDNCAVMAVEELKDYLENGNIKNSVNFPSVEMPRTSQGIRLCVLHKNKPKVLNKCLDIIGNNNGNVENMENKSRGEYAYTVLDVTGIKPDIVTEMESFKDVIRIRVIS